MNLGPKIHLSPNLQALLLFGESVLFSIGGPSHPPTTNLVGHVVHGRRKRPWRLADLWLVEAETQKEAGSSSKHLFSGAKMLVSGRVTSSNFHRLFFLVGNWWGIPLCVGYSLGVGFPPPPRMLARHYQDDNDIFRIRNRELNLHFATRILGGR